MNNYSDSRSYKFWKTKNKKYYRRHKVLKLACKYFERKE